MASTLRGRRSALIVLELRHVFPRPTMEDVLVGRQTELQQLPGARRPGPARPRLRRSGCRQDLARASCRRRRRAWISSKRVLWPRWRGCRICRSAARSAIKPRGADPAFVARELIESLRGAILLLDDLHWADAQTRETVPFLVGKTFLVATVRKIGLQTVAVGRHPRRCGLRPPRAGAARRTRRRLPRSASPARSRPGDRGPRGCSLGWQSPARRRAVGLRRAHREPGARARRPASRTRSRASIGAPTSGGARSAPRSSTAFGRRRARLDGAAWAGPDGLLAFRHPLLAEVVAGHLGEAERAASSTRVQRAWLRIRARRRATTRPPANARSPTSVPIEAFGVAERPGELAAHLAVAASCSDGADADALRLRAASLLVEVGRLPRCRGGAPRRGCRR